MVPPYTYEPLPSGKWIRLLQLHPGRYEDPVSFGLLTVELKDAPSYEAISYAWGDPNDTMEVLCGGASLHLTVSLCHGLRRFRDSAKPRLLWADAACIDQSNTAERGHQVNIMELIYRQAESVLVWLGEDDLNIATEVVNLVSGVNAYFDSQYNSRSSVDRNFRVRIMKIPELTKDSSLLRPSRWEALRSFLELPWFSRAWVLQEVAVARTALLFCGLDSLKLSSLIQAVLLYVIRLELPRLSPKLRTEQLVNAFGDIFMNYGRVDTWASEVPLLKEVEEDAREIYSINFPNVLETGRAFKATDPRDYVYAFLGHPSAKLPDGVTSIIRPDYNIDTDLLYLKVAFKIMTKDKDLAILSAVRHEDLNDLGTYPSWLPRWNKNSGGYAFGLGVQIYDASIRSMKRNRAVVKFSGKILRTYGVIFAKVHLRSIAYTMQHLDSTDLNETISRTSEPDAVEMSWKIAISAANEYPPVYRNALKAFRETLCAGTQYSDLESMETDFEDYCRRRCSPTYVDDLVLSGSSEVIGNGHHYLNVIQQYLFDRRFFTTTGGQYGLGPKLMQKNDICCILFGALVPFIIRPTETKDHYQLIGECYIEGVMQGEVVNSMKKNSWRNLLQRDRLKEVEINMV
jgi:hypothetical protein